ncbi:hypothetical protein [Bacillus sp. ISL-7]|uniref:hypothetical protein n=1 Tax=Bacillus sp. ISL-7 TaxID=2819136 RepID=UPI001BE8CE9E|nr:hypothetical protein [Bacillus sp. ISL-7]MBT2735138.1 hypothetical protein [Bacillus sp. ISL-7]
MRLDIVIDLLELEESTNDNGFPQLSIKSRKTVFAKKGSIRSSEFYLASQSGFSLELMFEVLTLEYESQKYIEYKSKMYKVIRTYEKDKTYKVTRTYEKDKMTELVCQAYDEMPLGT